MDIFILWLFTRADTISTVFGVLGAFGWTVVLLFFFIGCGCMSDLKGDDYKEAEAFFTKYTKRGAVIWALSLFLYMLTPTTKDNGYYCWWALRS